MIKSSRISAMTITALIFDMDGTLGDTLPSILIALRETFALFSGRTYTDDEISAMFGPSEEGIIGRYVPSDAYEPALQYYLKRYAALHSDQPFPGIRELMIHLKERGVRIGVATGKGPKSAAISMRAYGLESYIDCMETGSAQGGVKPELIRRVLDCWKLPAEQAAYVGDAQSDMRDARVAGVLPFGAAWSQSSTITQDDTPYLFTSVDALMGWFTSL
jgi:phosphoglycolate phosphatase-like HAD superfamily hydrolase